MEAARCFALLISDPTFFLFSILEVSRPPHAVFENEMSNMVYQSSNPFRGHPYL